MNATKPPPTHREELPVRECRSCGAYLRSFTGTYYCAPCVTPEPDLLAEDVWGALAEADLIVRRRAAEAVRELIEA